MDIKTLFNEITDKISQEQRAFDNHTYGDTFTMTDTEGNTREVAIINSATRKPYTQADKDAGHNYDVIGSDGKSIYPNVNNGMSSNTLMMENGQMMAMIMPGSNAANMYGGGGLATLSVASKAPTQMTTPAPAPNTTEPPTTEPPTAVPTAPPTMVNSNPRNKLQIEHNKYIQNEKTALPANLANMRHILNEKYPDKLDVYDKFIHETYGKETYGKMFKIYGEYEQILENEKAPQLPIVTVNGEGPKYQYCRYMTENTNLSKDEFIQNTFADIYNTSPTSATNKLETFMQQQQFLTKDKEPTTPENERRKQTPWYERGNHRSIDNKVSITDAHKNVAHRFETAVSILEIDALLKGEQPTKAEEELTQR